MKQVRWTQHALRNLADRDIDRKEADKTVEEPQIAVPAQSPREILMRRFRDKNLQQEMLLCAIIEETEGERIVITVYKTSKIDEYLKGRTV